LENIIFLKILAILLTSKPIFSKNTISRTVSHLKQQPDIIEPKPQQFLEISDNP
jgi:hypothetical protein